MTKPVKVFNARQLKNLKTLADYLMSLPRSYRNFNIKTFCAPKGERFHTANADEPELLPEKNHHMCGTVSCAVGHGPAAGLIPRSRFARSSWHDYMKEKFGWDLSGSSMEIFDRERDLYKTIFSVESALMMQYMFSGENKNGPRLAAKRIYDVISENGFYSPKFSVIK